jgi:hypothetical protein
MHVDEEHWDQALRVTLVNPEHGSTVNDFLESVASNILGGHWHP